MEIRVGPLVLTIHDDDRFLVSDPDATMHPDRQQGFFCADTRLASAYLLTLSRVAPVLVNSSVVQPFSARYEFVNDQLLTPLRTVARGTLHLRLDRTILGGVHEDYDLTNYSGERVELDLEVRVEGDYADLFDVKAHHLVRRGSLQSVWDEKAGALTISYRNADFRRGLRLQVQNNDAEPEFANGIISFRVCLEPACSWHTCLLWQPVLDDEPPVTSTLGCHSLLGAETGRDRQRRRWAEQVTTLETANPLVNAVVERAVHDLAALRIHRHDRQAAAHGGDEAEAWVPAAGVPWFVTLFGRDALVVSLQTLVLSSGFAVAALQALSTLQGTEYDDRRDLQPGKIEHEVRHGELARFRLIPQTPYYGTQDATTLFVWTAAEVWRWTGDRKVIERLRPNVERALSWIDTDGDLDHDGLQEYRTRAGDWGYYNQGWKDSGQAIVGADGSMAQLPIALCELQGYVVAAKRAWAQVLEEAFDDSAGGRRLRDEADRLAGAIEERFWWEAEGTYYLGLDGNKRPIASVSSNPGHLLWAGAVDAERAGSVSRRLLADDMWSGWGIRTLSARHPAYNPFSYQRGSVWPHDNGIIATGFRRYRQDQAAAQVAKGMFEAAGRFQQERLPEVFAGLKRDPGGFPAQYLGANVPQAWASGAVVHLLACLLAPEPSATNRSLRLHPASPDWLGQLRVRGLRVGDASVDVLVRDQEVHVEHQSGELTVEW